MASDFLGALKEAVEADAGLSAVIPGGWHANEGPVQGVTYPYATAVEISGMNSLMTSSSNVDDVKVRVRCWANTLAAALAAADRLQATLLGAGGLGWDGGGWCTRLRRVDRRENRDAGRAPGNGGVLRYAERVYLARVRREA